MIVVMNHVQYAQFFSFLVSGLCSTKNQGSPHCEPTLHIQHAVCNLQALPVSEVSKKGRNSVRLKFSRLSLLIFEFYENNTI